MTISLAASGAYRVADEPDAQGRTRLHGRWSVLSELDRPGRLFEQVTPNWFASVMGTGIVANAAATLPVQSSALRVAATVCWVASAALLVLLTAAFAAHWVLHPRTARAHAGHPVMSQFYGAPAMALLTVGAGTLLLGKDVVGVSAAVATDQVLWVVGTALGLCTSVWLPYTMITAHPQGSMGAPATAPTPAVPAWLMPVVPPMVSASTGALLLPFIPAGQPRLAMLVACYAMFGLSLIIGLVTITLVYSRLLHTGLPPVQAAPTVWIALGLVGQSITAANLLAAHATSVLPAADVAVLHGFGLVFGMAMGGFGALFFALATALTIHSARRGLRFSLTWWSFTFPVGTCVTGATAVGTATGSIAVRGLAIGLYVVLLAAWALVATHTVRGAASGRLFLPT